MSNRTSIKRLFLARLAITLLIVFIVSSGVFTVLTGWFILGGEFDLAYQSGISAGISAVFVGVLLGILTPVKDTHNQGGIV